MDDKKQEIMDRFENFLNAEKYELESYYIVNKAIEVEIKGKNGIYNFLSVFLLDTYILQFIETYPITVPDNRVNQVVEFLVRVNEMICPGKFNYEYLGKNIIFRYPIDFEYIKDFDDNLFRKIISESLNIVDTNYPKLLEIINNNKTAVETFYKIDDDIMKHFNKGEF